MKTIVMTFRFLPVGIHTINATNNYLPLKITVRTFTLGLVSKLNKFLKSEKRAFISTDVNEEKSAGKPLKFHCDKHGLMLTAKMKLPLPKGVLAPNFGVDIDFTKPIGKRGLIGKRRGSKNNPCVVTEVPVCVAHFTNYPSFK